MVTVGNSVLKILAPEDRVVAHPPFDAFARGR